MQASFDVPESAKAYVLKDAGRKWRDWKSSLTSKYIQKNKDSPEVLGRPADKWANCIDIDDCRKFVASRMSAEWASLRADKKDKRAQNKYDHHSGRDGYKK